MTDDRWTNDVLRFAGDSVNSSMSINAPWHAAIQACWAAGWITIEHHWCLGHHLLCLHLTPGGWREVERRRLAIPGTYTPPT